MTVDVLLNEYHAELISSQETLKIKTHFYKTCLCYNMIHAFNSKQRLFCNSLCKTKSMLKQKSIVLSCVTGVFFFHWATFTILPYTRFPFFNFFKNVTFLSGLDSRVDTVVIGHSSPSWRTLIQTLDWQNGRNIVSGLERGTTWFYYLSGNHTTDRLALALRPTISLLKLLVLIDYEISTCPIESNFGPEPNVATLADARRGGGRGLGNIHTPLRAWCSSTEQKFPYYTPCLTISKPC